MAFSNNYNVEVVSTHVSMLGESPFWSEKQKKLIYVDCWAKEVCALDLQTKESERKLVDVPELDFISLAIPYATLKDVPETNYLVVAMNKLYKFNSVTQAVNLLYEYPSKVHTFNDGKCDPKGRLWVGNPKFDNLSEIEINNEDGTLHCFDGNYGMKIVDGSYKCPNGLAWSPDYTKLFWNDLLKRIVWVYDFDMSSMSLTNKRVLFDFNNDAEFKESGGFPDGLTTDLDGNLYVACWEGGRVAKICTTTGKLVETIKMPVAKVTSLCFGGSDYTELLVTTASVGLDKVKDAIPDSGKIFRVTPKSGGFKGFAQNCFVETNQ